MNVRNKPRQRALLLHYAGEATNEIFDTLPNTTVGEGDDPPEKAVQASKQNREYEIYVFRQAKQERNETISAFHTRLRQLAVTCEFHDVDGEIKTQMVQSCSSHKLRTKALENPSYTLTQLLDAGKAMELSKTQAANIEENQSVNNLSSRRGNRRRRDRKSNKDGGRQTEKKSRDRKSCNGGHEDRKSSQKCRNCGGDYPHRGGKTSCPAYQATCRSCGKLNHFETVCQSKDKGESSNTRRSTVHKVSEEESSDEKEVYTFSLSTKALKDQPFFKIKVRGTPVTMMADSGASINILDEKEYRRLPNRPNLEPSSAKIYGYQSKDPLRVLRKFTTALESETKKLSDK